MLVTFTTASYNPAYYTEELNTAIKSFLIYKDLISEEISLFLCRLNCHWAMTNEAAYLQKDWVNFPPKSFNGSAHGLDLIFLSLFYEQGSFKWKRIVHLLNGLA
jgi:hypothetical protein